MEIGIGIVAAIVGVEYDNPTAIVVPFQATESDIQRPEAVRSRTAPVVDRICPLEKPSKSMVKANAPCVQPSESPAMAIKPRIKRERRTANLLIPQLNP